MKEEHKKAEEFLLLEIQKVEPESTMDDIIEVLSDKTDDNHLLFKAFINSSIAHAKAYHQSRLEEITDEDLKSIAKEHASSLVKRIRLIDGMQLLLNKLKG